MPNWPADELTVKEKIGVGTDTPSERLEVKGKIKLDKGNAVDEISIDGTFASTNDSAIVTNKAIKTYVDNQIANTNTTLTTQVASINTALANKADTTSLTNKADKAGSIAQDFQTNNLTVQGNLQVTGTTTFRDVEQHQGDLELGNEDGDLVKIHGKLRSTHSSKVLQVDSPIKVTGTLTADRVGIGTTNPTAALHVIGNLLGAAQDTAGNALRICCGATPEGKTAWQTYTGSTGVFVDVDTSLCRFSTTPIYIVNMHGSSYNWETTGGSSAYNRTATGFRVYVRFSDGRQFAPDFANSAGWHIQWVAIGN